MRLSLALLLAISLLACAGRPKPRSLSNTGSVPAAAPASTAGVEPGTEADSEPELTEGDAVPDPNCSPQDHCPKLIINK
jgi:hypothetical protein